MSSFIRLLSTCLALSVLISAPVHGQSNNPEREVEHMMVKKFVCPGDEYSGMVAFIEEKAGPILTEMRDDDRMINEWGLLTHDWGDEYNVGFYMRANNHFEWYAAWIELMNRMESRHDMWFDDAMQFCTKHQDNFYIHYRYR